MADGPTPKAQDPGALFRSALELHKAGRLDEAVAGYRQAVGLMPAYVPAHVNLAIALRSLGRFGEALAACDQALALTLDTPEVHSNRGHALRALKRPGEALESYDRALALAPDDTSLLIDRGAALFELRRWLDALETYDRAIALRPDLVDAHRNRALALRRLNRPADALAAVDRAIALTPDNAALHNLRGNVLEEMGDPAAAVASQDRAIALDPGFARAHNARGAMLFVLDRPEAALASHDRAIALSPNLAVAHRNRGIALRRLRRLDEAVDSQDRAIALEPQAADAYWNRSLCLLTAGRFAEGWRDYERRWEVGTFLKTASDVAPALLARFPAARDVQDLTGRNVLVVGEQGVGDVLMFASMLPDLMADAASVSLVCEPRLHRLFGHSFPGLTLLDADAATARLAGFHVVLGIGSLGRFYRNQPADFPGRPYLSARPEVRARWAERLGPANGLRRIGLSWRGGLATTRRSARSIDLAALRPVLDLPDCEFVSLQYGRHEAEVAEISAQLPRPIRLFPAAEIDDFEDLAGLVQSLDLVISVQTALVHLSGAVGVPALVMVPATPEWRYGVAAPTLPWYGAVTLFRQDDDETWPPVIRRVAEAAAR